MAVALPLDGWQWFLAAGVALLLGIAAIAAWLRRRWRAAALREDAKWLAGQLTIIVTTSASEANPSTGPMESVFASFSVVPGLAGVPKVIVCDWPELDDEQGKSCHHGRVQSRDLAAYRLYIERLQALCREGQDAWANTSCVTLTSRHGFGWAVGAGLDHVTTTFAMVVQHDRCFISPVPLANVVRAMVRQPEVINYVGFPVNNQSTYRNPEMVAARHEGLAVAPMEVEGLRLLPLLMWYDSTHVARVDYYRNAVLPRVQRGEFIEETFGRAEVAEVASQGLDAHRKYGNFLLLDVGRPRGYAVAHLEILRSKGPERQSKRSYGFEEICRIRRVLRDKLKRESQQHAAHEKQLRQRIGLVKRLADIGALSPLLRPNLEEVLELAAQCGLPVPHWTDLVVHRLFAFRPK